MKKTFIILLLIFAVISNTVVFAEEIPLPPGQRIVKEASLWLGTPYGYADGEDGYGSPVDCSGLVKNVYGAFGIELPRSSSLQAMEGERVELDEMIAGDIVCFMYEDGSIGHVGIYVGGNTMIHSPKPGKFVEFSRYFEDWGFCKAVFARRIPFESDYSPIEPDETISKELNRLFAEKNTVRTNHLQGLIIPEASAENIDVLPEGTKTIILEIGNPNMTVDGVCMPIDPSGTATPCIINNRTHLPLRNVAEELGVKVEWLGGEEGQIRLTYNGTEIYLFINSHNAIVNYESKKMDCVPIIIEGKTFLPIKFIADEFGWVISWDGVNKKISLSAMPSEIYTEY